MTVNAANSLLLDFYELTMTQAAFFQRMHDRAVFEFFVRKLPPDRKFLVAAGLEQLIDFLEGFQFDEAEIEWLRRDQHFQPAFLDFLSELRFTGDVDAMPEGTVFFEDEPIVRVTAPFPEAQLIETRLINLLQFQTMIASKAARCVLAARGKMLVDFGLRRAHGAEAGLFSARASYLAGFSATSTVSAGQIFGIPLSGTMAHSFITANDSEDEAFLAFARANPGNVVFLLDTYDTEAAARKLPAIAEKLKEEGTRINGVRLDSGDLAAHAKNVRDILNAGGLDSVAIFVSGNLDEFKIEELLQAGAPIDGFGVGTRMNTSADAPYLNCAYKLEEYAGRPRRKRSEGKQTWPGAKQVFRSFNGDGEMLSDTLTLEGDSPGGTPLLQPVMRGGKRIQPAPALSALRESTMKSLDTLPKALRSLTPALPGYKVRISEALRELTASMDAFST
jgi:nicotinate phosphoribosyltransferase